MDWTQIIRMSRHLVLSFSDFFSWMSAIQAPAACSSAGELEARSSRIRLQVLSSSSFFFAPRMHRRLKSFASAAKGDAGLLPTLSKPARAVSKSPAVYLIFASSSCLAAHGLGLGLHLLQDALVGVAALHAGDFHRP